MPDNNLSSLSDCFVWWTFDFAPMNDRREGPGRWNCYGRLRLPDEPGVTSYYPEDSGPPGWAWLTAMDEFISAACERQFDLAEDDDVDALAGGFTYPDETVIAMVDDVCARCAFWQVYRARTGEWRMRGSRRHRQLGERDITRNGAPSRTFADVLADFLAKLRRVDDVDVAPAIATNGVDLDSSRS